MSWARVRIVGDSRYGALSQVYLDDVPLGGVIDVSARIDREHGQEVTVTFIPASLVWETPEPLEDDGSDRRYRRQVAKAQA